MINLVKETGRIQFTIDNPTFYKNLDFLEPLFNELQPPMEISLETFIESETRKKYQIEFDTLAQFGFKDFIKNVNSTLLALGSIDRTHTKQSWNDHVLGYVSLKALGYEELADEMGYLMITNPPEAKKCLDVLGSLITMPRYDALKPIYIYNKIILTEAHELGKQYGIKTNKNIPYEIGKFIINKTVHYPETFDGCMRMIQEYDDYELYKVLGALDEGVKRKRIDIIEDKKVDMSEILDNVWKDADRIKMGSAGISYGVSLGIGLIGELEAGLPEAGLLAGLGFQAMDRFWGETGESMSEKIAKFVSPNYLVAVYDFKKQHALTD